MWQGVACICFWNIRYNGLGVEGISANVADNDEPGVVITQPFGLNRVFELLIDGLPCFSLYTVVLTQKPDEDVRVTIAPVSPSEDEIEQNALGITVNNQSQTARTLLFTPDNWFVPQEVNISAIADDANEGTKYVEINHSVIQGDEPDDGGAYDGIQVRSITVEVIDADSGSVVITPIDEHGEFDSITEVAEQGSFASIDKYLVVLSRQPTGTVTVTLDYDHTQLNLDKDVLTFNASNWNIPQTVTVSAQNDGESEGKHFSAISHTVTSADVQFNATTVNNVDVNIYDNDAPGILIKQSEGSTDVMEGEQIEVISGPISSAGNNSLNGNFAVGASNLDLENVKWKRYLFDIFSSISSIIQEKESNDTRATAMDLDQEIWSLAYHSEIGDRYSNTSKTIPHISINATGDNTFDYYKFTVANAGDKGIFDIDHGKNEGGSVDTYIHVYDSQGRLVVYNDDRSTGAGQGGSSHRYDSFIEYTFREAGTYYLRVGRYPSGNVVPAGATYSVHVSLQNHDFGLAHVAYDDQSGIFTITPSQRFTQSDSAIVFIQYEVYDRELETWLKGYEFISSSEVTADTPILRSIVDNDSLMDLTGLLVEITAGTGIGQIRGIVNHDSTSVTVDRNWNINPDSTSQYVVYQAEDADVFIDQYSVVLTSQPTANVTIKLTPEITRTFNSALGEEYVAVQLELDQSELVFTPDNWDIPQTVRVLAINDQVVDGSDAKAFADTLARANVIRGPLTIEGGTGNRSERSLNDPYILPGETNEYIADSVLSEDAGAYTLTDQTAPFSDDVSGYYVKILSGDGAGQERVVASNTTTTLTLTEAWNILPKVGDEYFYGPINPNLQVDESDQVDVLNIYNNDSPFSDQAVLTETRLYGLGMGEDIEIDGQHFDGGITYHNLESLEINLGLGHDTFTVEATHLGSTLLNAGNGADIIYVESIAGHTMIDAQGGADTIQVSDDTQLVDEICGLLTVIGDEQDTLNINDSGDENDNTGILTQTTLTGLDMPSLSEIQEISVHADRGNFVLTAQGYAGQAVITYEAAPEDWNAHLIKVQTAISTLYGSDDIHVSRSDNTYTVRFGGILAGENLSLLQWDQASSTLETDDSQTSVSVDITTRREGGTTMPWINNLQTITVDAASGGFTLLIEGLGSVTLSYDATAQELLDALEPLLNPNNVRNDLSHTRNVWVSKVNQVYLILFQGEHRDKQVTLASHTLTQADGSQGTIEIATRIEGINYYNIGTTNIFLGSGNDIVDVHSLTDAQTTISTAAQTDIINIDVALSLEPGEDKILTILGGTSLEDRVNITLNSEGTPITLNRDQLSYGRNIINYDSGLEELVIMDCSDTTHITNSDGQSVSALDTFQLAIISGASTVDSYVAGNIYVGASLEGDLTLSNYLGTGSLTLLAGGNITANAEIETTAVHNILTEPVVYINSGKDIEIVGKVTLSGTESDLVIDSGEAINIASEIRVHDDISITSGADSTGTSFELTSGGSLTTVSSEAHINITCVDDAIIHGSITTENVDSNLMIHSEDDVEVAGSISSQGESVVLYAGDDMLITGPIESRGTDGVIALSAVRDITLTSTTLKAPNEIQLTSQNGHIILSQSRLSGLGEASASRIIMTTQSGIARGDVLVDGSDLFARDSLTIDAARDLISEEGLEIVLDGLYGEIDIEAGRDFTLEEGSLLQAVKRVSLKSVQGDLTVKGTILGFGTDSEGNPKTVEELVIKAGQDVVMEVEVKAWSLIQIEAGGNFVAQSMDLLVRGPLGTLDVSIGGNLSYDGKLEATEKVILYAGGHLTLTAATIIKGNGTNKVREISLRADHDIYVQTSVEATDSLEVIAGVDGSGTIYLESGAGLWTVALPVSARAVVADDFAGLLSEADNGTTIFDDLVQAGYLNAQGEIQATYQGYNEAVERALNSYTIDEIRQIDHIFQQNLASLQLSIEDFSVLSDQSSWLDGLWNNLVSFGYIDQAGQIQTKYIDQTTLETLEEDLNLYTSTQLLAITGLLDRYEGYAGSILTVQSGASLGDIYIEALGTLFAPNFMLRADAGEIWQSSTSTPLEADVLTVYAANAIIIRTQVDNLNLTITDQGDASIDQLLLDSASSNGQIILSQVEVNDGTITIDAVGTIIADQVQIATDSDNNDIHLTSTQGQIKVGQVATTGSGDVILNAYQGSIQSLDASSLIVADDLIVTAKEDITLNTTINTLIADSTHIGNLTIDETDHLLINNIDLADGSVAVTASGNIIAQTITANSIALTAGNAGSINLGILNASGGSVTLNSAGNINASDEIDHINATTLNIISQADVALNTTITDLNAQVTAGSLILMETNGLNLDDVQVGGPITVTTTSGSIRATQVSATDQDITLTIEGAGDIEGGDVYAGTADITLMASQGNITNFDGTGSGKITAHLLHATASGSMQLDTTIDNLVAKSTVQGDIQVWESDAITLNQIQTRNGSIAVEAADAITATTIESLTDSDNNDVALTTTSGAITADSIHAGAQGDVRLTSAGAVTATLTADELIVDAAGAVNLTTTVSTIDVDASAPGNVSITETDEIMLTNITTADGSIQVIVGGAITATLLESLTDTDSNDISINATEVTLGTIHAGNTGDITLEATAGAISATALTADQLTADAVTGIELQTNVNSTIAHVSGEGSINIEETDAITLTDVTTAQGTITISAGTNITATSVESSSGLDEHDVTLTGVDIITGDIHAGAEADIILTASGGVDYLVDTIITGDCLVINQADSVRLNTQINTIENVLSFAHFEITEADDIHVESLQVNDGFVNITAAGSVIADAVGILTDADENDITITSQTGQILVGTLSAKAQGNITLTSTLGGVVSQSDTTITADHLTVTAASDITLNTAITYLTVTTTAEADLIVTEADSITLTDLTLFNGSIEIRAPNTITVQTIELTTGLNNSVTLVTTTSDINLGVINAGTQGTVTLDAGENIIDTSNTIIADLLTATAKGSIVLHTNVARLDVQTTQPGSITITEVDDIILSQVISQDGSIYITAAGNITANHVESLASDATNDISLIAQGSITATQLLAGLSGDVTLEAEESITATAVAKDLTVTVNQSGKIDLTTTIENLFVTHYGQGNLVVAETDDISLTDLDVNNGDITITAQSAIWAHQIEIQMSGKQATLTTQDNDSIYAGNLIVPNGTITLSSDGIIDDLAGKITTSQLIATAESQAILDTSVESVEVTTATAGAIIITETDDIDLLNIQAQSGAVTISSQSGTITATSISIIEDNEANDIDITSQGNLNIGILHAGTGQDSDVILTSETGDIAKRVTSEILADDLTLTAPGSITLNTTINRLFDAQITGTGNLSIEETDDLDVQNVDGKGDITITAQNTLTVIQSIQAQSDNKVIALTSNTNMEVHGEIISIGANSAINLTAATSFVLSLGAKIEIQQASSNITIQAQDIMGDNAGIFGDIVAGVQIIEDSLSYNITAENNDVTLTATNAINVTGNIIASGDIALNAQGVMDGTGLVVNGQIISLGDQKEQQITTGSGNIEIRGNILVTGSNADLKIQSAAQVNIYGQISAQDQIYISTQSIVIADTGNIESLTRHDPADTYQTDNTYQIKIETTQGFVTDGVINAIQTDANIGIIAGQIYINGSITADKQIEITASEDIQLDTVAGLTTNADDSQINVTGSTDVVVMGLIEANGLGSDMILSAADQLSIGGTKQYGSAQDKVGGTLKASDQITLNGGDDDSGLSVNIYAASEITTSEINSGITITASDAVDLLGVVLAGGKVERIYNNDGDYLGRVLKPFAQSDYQGQESNTCLKVNATGKVTIGVDIYAGGQIEIIGGDDGQGTSVVTYGTTKLKTLSTNSNIHLQGSSGIEILGSPYSLELLPDQWPTHDAGTLDDLVRFELTIDLGDDLGIITRTVTIAQADTQDNSMLSDLVQDIQTAINTALNDPNDLVEVTLNQGKLMFVSNGYAFSIQGLDNADLLGLSTEAVVARAVAPNLSAAQEGSSITLKPGSSGKLYIGGHIKSYQVVSMGSTGASDIELDVSSTIETINDSIILHAGQEGWIKGQLIAGGVGSDIILSADKTLTISNDLIAQDVIKLSGGKTETDGQVSIMLERTAYIQTANGIVINAVNDVMIDTSMTTTSSDSLISITSTDGDLYLTENYGIVTAAGVMSLEADVLNLKGVIASDKQMTVPYAIDLTIGDQVESFTGAYELKILGHEEVNLRGSLTMDGALFVETETEDINLVNQLNLQKNAILDAGRDIVLGDIGVDQDNVQIQLSASIQSTANITFIAAQTILINKGSSLITSAPDTTITLNTQGDINLIGAIYAGAEQNQDNNWLITQENAQVILQATENITLGGLGLDENGNYVLSSGQVKAGQIDLDVTGGTAATSLIIGEGSFLEATGDADDQFEIDINTDKDIQLLGGLFAQSEGADIRIASAEQLLVNASILADEQITLIGGIDDTSDSSIIVNKVVFETNDQGEFIYDADLNKIIQGGGLLNTGITGQISLSASENIEVDGMLGKVYNNSEPAPWTDVSRIDITTTGTGSILATGLINAENQVNFNAVQDIIIYEDAVVISRGTSSSVHLSAIDTIYVYKSLITEDRALVSAKQEVHLEAGSVLVVGVIKTENENSRIEISCLDDIEITGDINAANTIELYAGERDANGTFTNLADGQGQIRGNIHISQEGQIIAGGENLTADNNSIIFQAANDIEIVAYAVEGDQTLTIAQPYLVRQERIVLEPVGVIQIQDPDTPTLTIPQTVYYETTYLKEVGQEDVDVGTQYTTFDVDVDQIGWYDPSTGQLYEVGLNGEPVLSTDGSDAIDYGAGADFKRLYQVQYKTDSGWVHTIKYGKDLVLVQDNAALQTLMNADNIEEAFASSFVDTQGNDYLYITSSDYTLFEANLTAYEYVPTWSDSATWEIIHASEFLGSTYDADNASHDFYVKIQDGAKDDIKMAVAGPADADSNENVGESTLTVEVNLHQIGWWQPSTSQYREDTRAAEQGFQSGEQKPGADWVAWYALEYVSSIMSITLNDGRSYTYDYESYLGWINNDQFQTVALDVNFSGITRTLYIKVPGTAHSDISSFDWQADLSGQANYSGSAFVITANQDVVIPQNALQQDDTDNYSVGNYQEYYGLWRDDWGIHSGDSYSQDSGLRSIGTIVDDTLTQNGEPGRIVIVGWLGEKANRHENLQNYSDEYTWERDDSGEQTGDSLSNTTGLDSVGTVVDGTNGSSANQVNSSTISDQGNNGAIDIMDQYSGTGSNTHEVWEQYGAEYDWTRDSSYTEDGAFYGADESLNGIGTTETNTYTNGNGGTPTGFIRTLIGYGGSGANRYEIWQEERQYNLVRDAGLVHSGNSASQHFGLGSIGTTVTGTYTDGSGNTPDGFIRTLMSHGASEADCREEWMEERRYNLVDDIRYGNSYYHESGLRAIGTTENKKDHKQGGVILRQTRDYLDEYVETGVKRKEYWIKQERTRKLSNKPWGDWRDTGALGSETPLYNDAASLANANLGTVVDLGGGSFKEHIGYEWVGYYAKEKWEYFPSVKVYNSGGAYSEDVSYQNGKFTTAESYVESLGSIEDKKVLADGTILILASYEWVRNLWFDDNSYYENWLVKNYVVGGSYSEGILSRIGATTTVVEDLLSLQGVDPSAIDANGNFIGNTSIDIDVDGNVVAGSSRTAPFVVEDTDEGKVRVLSGYEWSGNTFKEKWQVYSAKYRDYDSNGATYRDYLGSYTGDYTTAENVLKAQSGSAQGYAAGYDEDTTKGRRTFARYEWSANTSREIWHHYGDWYKDFTVGGHAGVKSYYDGYVPTTEEQNSISLKDTWGNTYTGINPASKYVTHYYAAA